MYLFITILFCMSTDVPVHHCTYSVYFFFSGTICTMFFKLTSGYLPTNPPENHIVPVYPHASPLPKNNDLPVPTTTCVPAHSCTRSWPYLFIFILSFRLTVKDLPVNVSTVLHVHRRTCSSVYLFSLFIYFSASPAQWPFNSYTGVPTHKSTRK